THGKGPLLPRRTLGLVRSGPRPPRRADSGVSPRPDPSRPRRSPDTAPKGAETHPGDGRLSLGTASTPFLSLYHNLAPKLAPTGQHIEAGAGRRSIRERCPPSGPGPPRGSGR